MTASSVDVFPCRVQLIGLPPSNRLVSANTFARPPIAKIRGVSRNLFGAPDPSEMKNLYEQEAERVRSYVLQRYNFDTKPLKPANQQEDKPHTDRVHASETKIMSDVQPTQTPTLIEQELRLHEQRLHNETYCLNREISKTEQTKEKIADQKNIRIANICNEFQMSLPPAAKLQKPYRRQSLLKESFYIRKNRVCGQYPNAEKFLLENCESSNRNLEIRQISQRVNIQQRRCDIQHKGNKLPTCNNFISLQNAEIEEKISKVTNCSDNCTKLSLQLVVSTHNAS